MKRSFLRWFYVAVQFIMLAVSIPKVATLFHAYEGQNSTMLLLWGLDIRSWAVGVAIDLTATVTTWAAMAKYEETRKRTALIAPAVIILVCTALSVVANYEDAATLLPEQYKNVALFTHPALVINPLLISAPPVLVLLLILLVPSVLAQPQVRSLDEITAEAEEAEAKILAQGRIREAKARANAKVRGAQLSGFVQTVGAMTNRSAPAATPPASLPASQAVQPLYQGDDSELSDDPPAAPRMTRALWNAMSLKERVMQSGVITPQEVAEVLGISLAHARNLCKEVPGEPPSVQARKGVSYTALIDAVYERRTKDSFAWARKLEQAFGIKKRGRQLQVVPIEPDEPVDEEEVEGEA